MILIKKHILLKSSVCVGLFALFAGSAMAADLPTSSLPPVEEVQYDEQVEFASGWYLRADAGVALGQDPDIYTEDSSFGGRINYRNISTDQVGTFGAGFGYQFNNGFRMDLTAEYTAPMRYTGNSKQTITYGGNKYEYLVDFETRRHTGVGMLNAYYDFNMGKYKPYIGAGVGMAWTEVYKTTVDDPDYTNYPGYFYPNRNVRDVGAQERKTNYSFAWALMTGVAFPIATNWDLDVGYKYQNIGKVSSGSTVAWDQRPEVNGQPNPYYRSKRVYYDYTRLEHVGEHQVRVGLRYKFDN